MQATTHREKKKLTLPMAVVWSERGLEACLPAYPTAEREGRGKTCNTNPSAGCFLAHVLSLFSHRSRPAVSDSIMSAEGKESVCATQYTSKKTTLAQQMTPPVTPEPNRANVRHACKLSAAAVQGCKNAAGDACSRTRQKGKRKFPAPSLSLSLPFCTSRSAASGV